jgi:hypothetical protein
VTVVLFLIEAHDGSQIKRHLCTSDFAKRTGANQVIFVRLGVPHPGELLVFMLTADDRVVIRRISGTTGR